MNRLTAALTDDRATSPTIGAVLLVGITVVIATTAGTQLFSLVESQQKPFATATIDSDPEDDRVVVTWISNTNAEALQVTFRVGDQSRTITLSSVSQTAVADRRGITVNDGEPTQWDAPALTDGDEVFVTVSAVSNGETFVISDQSVAV